MANLKIEIKNSKFVSHNGVNVEKFEEHNVEGNSWTCRITQEGRVDCIATRFYNGERHQIKFKIDKGYVKVLLKINDGRPRALKSYKLEKWPVDGIIVLPEGYIDNRRPHFRDASFQRFLDEYGLTAIRCESANGIFATLQEHNGHRIMFNEVLDTDGKMKVISEDTKVDKKSIDKPFTIKQMVEISEASWVIKTVEKFGKYQYRILYTLDDPKQIKGLPKFD